MKFYIDIDGVLTDGKIWIDHKGRSIKSFNSRDARAIKQLSAHGFEVVLLTASSWPGSKFYAEKVGAQLIVARDKSLAINIHEKHYAVADDSWDLELLMCASRAFCPADAIASVKEIKGIEVLETKGGHGVIAEIVEKICVDSDI